MTSTTDASRAIDFHTKAGQYGLRAYFFGLAALAWFIQPWAFVLATVAVLYWRDSRSATLDTLAGPVTGKELP